MLNTNSELYHYLLALSSTCRALGLTNSADRAEQAARFITGSPSEFLHEAQQALLAIVSESDARLGDEERARLLLAVKEIEHAFKQVGGA